MKTIKNSDLVLSPKHGVNPTIPLCFWCGNAKDEIALMGKLGDGDEDLAAPQYMTINYDPCPACEERMNKGFTIFEAMEEPIHQGQAELTEGAYPTGRWLVVKMEAGKAIFGEEAEAAKKACVDPEIFKMLTDAFEVKGDVEE